MSRNAINEKILQSLDKKRMTQTELAAQTGIALATLNRRLRGKSAFTTDELQQISRVLDLSFAMYFTRGRETHDISA